KCPLYSEPRTRTLATIRQSFRPTSLHAWAWPDPSFSKVTAIELWRSLLAYIRTLQLSLWARGFGALSSPPLSPDKRPSINLPHIYHLVPSY
ncbi:hypothetical protein HPB47_007568, partial [Ixodes persulcatus]